MGTNVMPLTLLVVAVLLSAFFSASETALLSMQKLRLRQLAANGSRRVVAMTRLAEHPERFLPTVLIGNNLVNSLAAAVCTLLAVRLFGDHGLVVALATVFIAVVLVVIAENFPKTLGSRYAERVAVVSATPILWLERLLFPLVMPLQWVNRWINQRLGVTKATITQEEIEVLVTLGQESGGLLQTESDMLLGTLRINRLGVNDVMTPRADIVWVEEGMTLEEFLEFNGRQRFSHFPVFAGSTDKVVGVLETRDVLFAMGRGDVKAKDRVTKLAHPPRFLPETLTIPEALAQIRETKADLCLVVDEFGAVTGLATLHQLLGYIIGIVDESAQENVLLKEPNATVIKGRTDVSVANDQLGLGIPAGEYRTVAGFVMDRLGRVPVVGDSVTYGKHRLTVKATRGPRIEEIRVTAVQSTQ